MNVPEYAADSVGPAFDPEVLQPSSWPAVSAAAHAEMLGDGRPARRD